MSKPSERPFERYPGQMPVDASGMGEAANGLIRAVVGSDGRVSALSLAPELRRLGPRGTPVMDSETLAAEIAAAVNAALDDLDATLRAHAGEFGDRLGADLDRIAEDFERALDQVATDIGRAERRLEH